MTAQLRIRYDRRSGSWHIELHSPKGLLAKAEDSMDAVRIAQGIAAWTQLPIVEVR